ncbi:MAG: DUF1549 domain-containing protein [Planctomycetales bacterium]|nr:DUF1549 domain-containing protein [Planctomycetales bacterium]
MLQPRLFATAALFVACLPLAAGIASAAEPASDTSPAVTAEQEQFFEKSVRPVLAARCYECHGPEKQESGLRLDARAFILKGGDAEEPAAIVGEPDRSKLIHAVRYEGDLQMPPEEKLSDKEIEALVAWVKMGLPWPKSDGAPVVLSEEEQRRQMRESHWAFQPIVRPALPEVSNAAWPQTGIDRFVLAKLEQRGLAPSDEADRPTLIRRLSFDLLGLPPSPANVEAFVADESPDAYEQLVDRLLASPHYGERWGRHWLDLARYADTRGYAFNRERRYPYSYTYRDYVIRALNEDKPYDRFVVEQLAADLLDLGDDNRALAGLGFLTVGRKFNNRHDDLDDQIDVVGRGLMGLTVACARCHDHKYDPIPMDDYYSLYGVFASSTEPGELPLIGVPEETPGYPGFKKRLDELTAERDRYVAEQHRRLLDVSRGRVVEYLVRALTSLNDEQLKALPFNTLGPDDLKSPLVQRWRDYLQKQVKPDDAAVGLLLEWSKLPDENFAEGAATVLKKWQALPAGTEPGQFNPIVREKLAEAAPATKADAIKLFADVLSGLYEQLKSKGDVVAARAGLDAAEQQLAGVLLDAGSPTDIPLDQVQQYFNRAERNEVTERQKKIDAHQVNSPGAPPRAMVLQENGPHNPRVFLRGNHARPGKPVPRQFLYVVAGENREPFPNGSGRLDLARKIADPANPLTSRVIVNRVWMHHFGEPLVDTPSDFGVRCERPDHAELLDYLATKLVDSGWSLKALHREILRSSVYQQQSIDRPDAREIDPENRLLWRMNRRRLEFEITRDSLLAAAGKLDMSLYGRAVELTTAPFTQRRAVYGFVDRQDLPNLFRVFDFASPDQSSPRRPQTTVPQQALFMMNSPFVMEQARSLIARPELARYEATDERVDALYRLLFGREASAQELEIGRQFIEATSADNNADAKLNAWEQYAQLLMLSNEFVFVD